MAAKILVTGGAGFIGSALIGHLKERGHEVYVVDDLSFGRRELVDLPDDRFFVQDIRDRAAMRRILEQVAPDKVLHLAAVHFIPYCNQHPAEATDINISGTMSVLDACAGTTSVKQVFVASTAAVYPIHNGPLAEDHEVGPLDIYGITKLATERIAAEYHHRTGVTVVIGRFFNAFGPNETNPHLIPEIQRQVLAGQRTLQLGNLAPKRDFIHTSDMGRAMITLLDKVHSGCGIFNIGRGIEYSVLEVVEAFERQLGEPLQVEVDPARVRKVERMHLLADVSRLKALGWEPEWELDEGVATLLKEDAPLARS
jgi:UDP-glucose 4-epimerase